MIIGYGKFITEEQNIPGCAKSALERVLWCKYPPPPHRDADRDPILAIDVNYDFSDKPISSKITHMGFRPKSEYYCSRWAKADFRISGIISTNCKRLLADLHRVL
jgi:hypothetical protein